MLQLKNLLGVASYFQDKLDQLLRLALPKSVHRLVLRCFCIDSIWFVTNAVAGAPGWPACAMTTLTSSCWLPTVCIKPSEEAIPSLRLV